MKEQVISFETAKLAKEKGFEWPVKSHYQISLTERVHPEDGKSGSFGWEKGELSLQDGYFINNWKESDFTNKSWYHCAAPTQALLQKWVREEHNLHIYISTTPSFDSMESHKSKYKSHVRKPFSPFTWTTAYYFLGDSYEEALEKGLVEALKII